MIFASLPCDPVNQKEYDMEENIVIENRFDIDIGYIKKSPCRECSMKDSLPECSNCCETLAQLQELLVGSISCSKSYSECEEFSI